MASVSGEVVNCVICRKGISEQKPFVGSESVKRFKRAVKCFCSLLRTVNVEGGKRVEEIVNGAIKCGGDEEDVCGVNCCEDCFGVLEEIWRLQETIDELKASQMEHVNGLKIWFLNPEDDDHYNFQDKCATVIEKEMDASVLKEASLAPTRSEGSPAPSTRLSFPRVPNILRRSSKRKRELPPTTDHTIPIQCSRPLRSVFVDAIFEGPISSSSPTLKSDPLEDFNVSSDTPSPKQQRLSTEETPSATEEEDDTDSDAYEEYVPSTPEPSEGGSDGGEDSDPPDAQNIVETPVQNTEEGRVTFRKKRQRVPLNDLFYSLTDDTLVYKYTLLQSSHGGTWLHCLEPGCTTIARDLNFQSLFSKMGAHVDNNHLPGIFPVVAPDAKRKCPFPQCEQVFGYNATVDFRFHLLVHQPVNRVICDVCWKPVLDNGSSLQTHKWHHRNKKEKLMAVPPKVPPKANSFPGKPAVKSNGLSLRILLNCDYFTKLSDNLLLYKLTPIKIIPSEGLSCQEPECPSNFLAKGTDYQAFEEIKVHVKNAHVFTRARNYPDKSRSCPLCPDQEAVFDSGNLFCQHLSRNHAPLGYFICQCCWKPVKDAKCLASHMLTHQVRPASVQNWPPKITGKSICDECGKEFTAKSLAKHKLTHLPDNLRPTFDCDQCPRKFLTDSSLRRHVEVVHVAPDRKRVRTCPICNKQYLWRDGKNFTIHVNSHSQEMPYICDLCGKAFQTEKGLATHQKTMHLEADKRYQCKFCEVSYKQQKSLRKHLLNVHKDKVPPTRRQNNSSLVAPESRPDFIGPKIAFPCEFCGKVLPLKCRLTQHLKKYHAAVVKL